MDMALSTVRPSGSSLDSGSVRYSHTPPTCPVNLCLHPVYLAAAP